jgi:hypothetical protein
METTTQNLSSTFNENPGIFPIGDGVADNQSYALDGGTDGGQPNPRDNPATTVIQEMIVVAEDDPQQQPTDGGQPNPGDNP